MNVLPEVSVIVPVYNVEGQLKRCLNSILAQSYTNFELVCVNDASPDNSAAILAEFAERDTRVHPVTQPENMGLSAARNTGLEQARGKWILFVDGDDCIHPQLLEHTLALAEQHNADLVSFDYERVEEDFCICTDNAAQVADSRQKLTEEPLYHRKKRGRWVIHGSACAQLYKQELLQGLRFEPILYEDYPFTLQVLLRNPRTVITKAKLYYYVNKRGSIMNRDFLPEHLLDYQTGLEVIWNACRQAAAKEQEHVLRQLFPDIIKQMFNRIRRSDTEKQPELWKAFAAVLRHLDSLGCLKFRGHKISRWIHYKKIMSKY